MHSIDQVKLDQLFSMQLARATHFVHIKIVFTHVSTTMCYVSCAQIKGTLISRERYKHWSCFVLFVLVHGCTICSILTQGFSFCCWLGSYVCLCVCVDSQHNTYAIDHRSEDGIGGGTRLHSASSTRSVGGQV